MALNDLKALENHRTSKMQSSELGAFTSRFGMHAVSLPAGTQLYKYSGAYPFKEDRQRWSEWWNARSGTVHVLGDGRQVSWTGLSERLTKAMNSGQSDVRQARVRSAVKYDWSTMANLFIAELKVPAMAWFGQCRGQRVSDSGDPAYQNVHLIGGDYQYYIPELEQHEVRILSAHCGSDEGKF